MDILINIPAPPLPGGALGLSIAMAAIVTGLLLLLFGHIWIWRLIPAAAASLAGFCGGDYLAAKIGCDVLFASIGLGAAAGLLALVTARAIWIGVFALMLAVIITGVLAENYAVKEGPAPGTVEGYTNLAQWYEMFGETVSARKDWILSSHRKEVALAIAATVAFGLLLGTHKPFAARILCICTAGSIIMVSGCIYAISAVVDSMDLGHGHRPIVVLVLVFIGIILGSARQWHYERAKLAKTQPVAEKSKEKNANQDAANKDNKPKET